MSAVKEKVENNIEARAYMDYTKGEILADAAAALISQAYKNPGRVNELIN